MAKLRDLYRASVGGGTEARKREHIETVLTANVAAKGVTTIHHQHSHQPRRDITVYVRLMRQ